MFAKLLKDTASKLPRFRNVHGSSLKLFYFHYCMKQSLCLTSLMPDLHKSITATFKNCLVINMSVRCRHNVILQQDGVLNALSKMVT
jgi:hypothetical protein